MNTVKKLHMGEDYENTNGEKFRHMGGTCWAVVNEEGKVNVIGNNIEELYDTKKVAEHAATI